MKKNQFEKSPLSALFLRRLGRRRVNWTIHFSKNLIGKLAYQNA
jgi:hypothetical protein